MKKTLLLIILLTTNFIYAQYTTIPNTVFEQKLIDLGIDSDGIINGQVLNSDIIDVHSLNLNNTSGFIHDLSGIEGFINLDTLICRQQTLNQIDLSANTKLKYLDVYQADLHSLDVSNLPLLEVLKCGNEVQFDYVCDCFNNIDTLDLTNNLYLRKLECNNNGLNNLLLPNSSNLEYIEAVYNNMITFDATILPNLKYLDLSFDNLQNINITNCSELEYLNVKFNHLSSINLTNNHRLISLDVNKNGLTSLDLSNNLLLEELYLGYFFIERGVISEPLGIVITSFKIV